ncbi:unnamed protein product [Linum trigynum]|uniref:Uncharacterized protein n=1 Tax=Linum trigynum TaxID=586398 RepID=A0AAV2D913_9ROSI
MGLDTTTMTMTAREYTRDFHYQEAYSAIYRPKHRDHHFRASNTNVVKFRTPWRILHTLLTQSVIPGLHSGHMVTNRGLISLHSLIRPTSPLHLGSVVATTFSRVMGRDRVDTMHLGASSRGLHAIWVNTTGYTIISQASSFLWFVTFSL